ncbi:MAG: PQQ-binding-like beta-propeller repeat protein [Planctomycetota bacterium]|nr:PQQ-binding-like beta-propeller repeat protein [Planctomycetota bacterium]
MDAAHPQAAVAPASEAAARPASPNLRLWPAVAIVVLMWTGYYLPGYLEPGTFTQFMGLMWSPIVGALLMLLWWLFLSRIPWKERLIGLAGLAAAGGVLSLLYHPSLGTMGIVIYTLPVALSAWMLWLAVTGSLVWPARRLGMIAVFAVAWGYFALLRLDGLDGNFNSETSFRWQPTKEDAFLAARTPPPEAPKNADPAAEAAKPLALMPGDWPGFRGPGRDARVPGVIVGTDWQAQPPKEIWRRKVGPGWSSFCVVGSYLYTQEQWGEEEAVVCYETETGKQRWAHTDPARFTEVVAGPGPRATPTFFEGRLYTLGATGVLNCLDARTGALVWSKDTKADSGAKLPQWGFSASPLVAKGVVSVYVAGPAGKAVLGYGIEKGDLRWSAGKGEMAYVSTQLSALGGVEQILTATDDSLFGLDPESGKELWTHAWPTKGMARVVQPAVVGPTDVLFGSPFGLGTKRLRVAQKDGAWSVGEVWHTRALSPYFNDLVVHKDCLYGFTSTVFACVGLEDGGKKWHASGYGNGQALLLPDQDLLVLLSERGEVCLVQADPAGHKEIARMKALEGKTWNHPAIAHGKLFVRNGEEAACYQLHVDPASARP